MTAKFLALIFTMVVLNSTVTVAEPRSAVVPSDVVSRVFALQPSVAARYCKKPPPLRGYLNQRPPARVRGYNSRMDNAASVEGARTLQKMSADMSQAAAYAFVSRDARTKADMISVLAYWARNGAFTQTVSCTKNGQLLNSCTEWMRSDGKDLSSTKDFSTVQMAISSLKRGYFLAAADHQAKERAADHEAIQKWFQTFDKRMKKPSSVYFGLQMGWYWPKIDAVAARGGPRKARGTASKLGRGLDKLVLKDGSMKNRTTRGDRALWYHNSAINETVHSMEMMRATGANIPKSLDQKLHLAVNLFIRSVSDYSVIDPWARQALNARYSPNRQEWNRNWQHNTWGGSWWHIYAYRYPDRQEARWLQKTVSDKSKSAFVDEEIGIGIGCVYNAASAVR